VYKKRQFVCFSLFIFYLYLRSFPANDPASKPNVSPMIKPICTRLITIPITNPMITKSQMLIFLLGCMKTKISG
jgi:hypothetical protein